MNIPAGEVLRLTTVGSTQDEAASCIRSGRREVIAVIAEEQTAGRGRRGRNWTSPRGACLALSVILWDHSQWPRPELLGMAVACAVADVLECQLQWPNDLVVTTATGRVKKVGGLLAETFEKIPVVGIGINLSLGSYPPEMADSATSLGQEGAPIPEDLPGAVLDAIRALPEPTDWSAIQTQWIGRDVTEGKRFTLPDGREGVAAGVSEDGWLVVICEGDTVVVPSAEA